jgi:hypothetical protein
MHVYNDPIHWKAFCTAQFPKWIEEFEYTQVTPLGKRFSGILKES